MNYDKPLYRAHTEALFKGLLIHLDDSSPNIQVSLTYTNKLIDTFFW